MLYRWWACEERLRWIRSIQTTIPKAAIAAAAAEFLITRRVF